MRIRNTNGMLFSGQIWNAPVDFDNGGGCQGVLLAKAGPNLIAVYHGGIGWCPMTYKQFAATYTTEFPQMCPWSQTAPGWCIVPKLEMRNGGICQYAMMFDNLEYALRDDLEGLHDFHMQALTGSRREVSEGRALVSY